MEAKWVLYNGVWVHWFEDYDDGAVSLSKDTWTTHILPAHPYMPDHFDKLVETLRKPHKVVTVVFSGTAEFRKLYLGQPAIPGHCRRNPYLLIQVNRGSRSIKTVYFSDEVNDIMCEVLWPKP